MQKEDVSFEHYRVPLIFQQESGEPPNELLYRYSQSQSRFLEEVMPYHFMEHSPSPRGGKTVCKLWYKGKVFAKGEAVCSFSDNFCYETGRKIAYGRALKKAKEKMLGFLRNPKVRVSIST